MCGCTNTAPSHEADAAETDIVLRVDDMTCGHCAGTIEKAIRLAFPGTEVEANPATKLVTVLGSRDLAVLKRIISDAGYTATAA